VSHCHESLGDLFAALETCSPSNQDRLARLLDGCQQLVDDSVTCGQFRDSAAQLQRILSVLDNVAEPSPQMESKTASVRSQRDAVLAAARQWFTQQFRAARPEDRTRVCLSWSEFEEVAGEPLEAAKRAEEAGDYYRAHRLFRKAMHFGEAVRVLSLFEKTPKSLQHIGEAREEGGDSLGAAKSYEEAGQLERAAKAFEQAGDIVSAVRCLRAHLGADDQGESETLAGLMCRGEMVEEFVGLCLKSVRSKGRASTAVKHLRDILRSDAAAQIPESLRAEVNVLLETVNAPQRAVFDRKVRNWIDTAWKEVLAGYASTWGFDLGTTNCCVAIYSKNQQQPSICTWKGADHIPSTFAIDADGNEWIGLTSEQLLSPALIGGVVAAKRKIGTRTVYRMRNRQFRPEEVAARLIRNARRVVEQYLGEQVRTRLRHLAAEDRASRFL